MAQYERHFTGSFQRLLVYLEQEVLNGSVTASREGEEAFLDKFISQVEAYHP